MSELPSEQRVLLGQYADILNEYGVDSPPAQEFLKTHADKEELIRLAHLAEFLKRKFEGR